MERCYLIEVSQLSVTKATLITLKVDHRISRPLPRFCIVRSLTKKKKKSNTAVDLEGAGIVDDGPGRSGRPPMAAGRHPRGLLVAVADEVLLRGGDDGRRGRRRPGRRRDRREVGVERPRGRGQLVRSVERHARRGRELEDVQPGRPVRLARLVVVGVALPGRRVEDGRLALRPRDPPRGDHPRRGRLPPRVGRWAGQQLRGGAAMSARRRGVLEQRAASKLRPPLPPRVSPRLHDWDERGRTG